MQLAAVVAASSVIASLWPFASHTHDQGGRAGAWRFVVHQDQFSGQTLCTLRARNAYLERGVVMFSLPPRQNVSEAVYRIDDGAIHSVRESDLEVAEAGLPVYQDGKDALDPGLARVPQRYLLGAHSVAFQLRLGGPAYRFDLHGFDAALAAATTSGCQAGAFRNALR